MKNVDTETASDAQLLARYEQGRDQAAFNELVRRYGPLVMSTVMRQLGNADDAEDAFQATFLALARSVPRIEKKAAVVGWLHKTAQRAAKTIQRGQSRNRRKIREKTTSTTDVPSTSSNPEDKAVHAEQLRILDEEISKLPKQLRSVIVLCHLDGMSQQQVADRLDIPRSTVRDRLTRGQALLKHRLLRSGVTATLAAMTTYAVASRSSIPAQLAAHTTKMALSYAAGNPAVEIGVSQTVYEAANSAVYSLAAKNLATVGLVLVALTVLSASLFGLAKLRPTPGILLTDDFSGSNLANERTVTWTPAYLEPGSVDTSTGELVLSRNTGDGNAVFESAVDALDLKLRDVSARTEARVTESNGAAGLAVRTQTIEDAGAYFVGVAHSPQFRGSIAIAGKASSGFVNEFFKVEQLPYDVRRVFSNMQIDVFGDEIRVWVWRVGTPMPSDPMIVKTDSTYSDGHIRLAAPRPNTNLETGGTAVFRSVQVANMPIHDIPKGNKN